jgi:hypothetical protein
MNNPDSPPKRTTPKTSKAWDGENILYPNAHVDLPPLTSSQNKQDASGG